MPEDMGTELKKVLDVLEDDTFDTPILRHQKYKVLQNVLDSDAELNLTDIQRVLAVCSHNIKDDKKYSGHSLNIISSILKRIKTGQFATVPDLLPSALAIIKIMKTTVLVSKAESLQNLCFDTLMLYPDEILVTIATSHIADVIELFQLYCHQRVSTDARLLPSALLTKLLKILPQEKRTIFVKDNIATWFTKFIPSILNSELCGLNNVKHFEALELLAEELQLIEYSDNPHWCILFGCIYNPKKYPLIMKSLLDAGNPYWNRLWIAFIKLLKNQITRSNTQGSPINALLPVVESAFKMDVPNRCRAFKCWEVLIDNFSKETNEVYIAKRLKLLIIPLHSNNAKVEETAIAKLNTWWHLIRQFQKKLNKFFDSVVIAFLNFCFGKNVVTPKANFVPGLISNKVKKMCIEAFINIAGHVGCSGCCSVPGLDVKLMNTQELVCYWNNFAYCLRIVITIAADNAVGVTTQQVQCLWKSFVLTIGELPENNVRRDIFNELLSVLENLTQVGQNADDAGNIQLPSVVLNLIFTLFTNDNKKIMSLLTSMQANEGPMFKILSIILGPISKYLYDKNDSAGSVSKLKPVTNCILNEKVCDVSNVVDDWLMKNLSPNDNTLTIWTALAQSIHENSNKKDTLNLKNILLWPLQNMGRLTDLEMASSAWYNLYILAYTNNSSVDHEISKLIKTMKITDNNKVFALNASLAILKLKLVQSNISGNNFEEDIHVIKDAMSKLEDYKCIGEILLVLVDTLILLTSKIAEIPNDNASEHALITTIKILTFLKQQSPDVVKGLLQFIEQVHKNIRSFLKNTSSSQLKQKIINELVKYATLDSKHQHTEITLFVKSCLGEVEETDKSFYTSMETILNSLEKQTDFKKNINFTTPVTKAITRKAKKREASIVNTVVENGEEYVVVKSNWKFNPRKLTENQKEKLQRKREDIPALYQDLSQSQDEFKMITWKTDSQDSSTTNSSKSSLKTGEQPASILKFMPSSDVVPKIIENIFAESTPKSDETNETVHEAKKKLEEDNTPKLKQMLNKDTKSPRVALKDRVFRNVRNLIEKSSLTSNCKDLSHSLIQIENVPKTPVATELNVAKEINSAPSKINTERPSRVKRKPKKFDDTELFGLKKRRNSSGLNDSQVTNESQSQSDDDDDNVKANKSVDLAFNNETQTNDVKSELKICDEDLNKSKEVVQSGVVSLHENGIGINDSNDNGKNDPFEIAVTMISQTEKVDDTSSKCAQDKKSLTTPKSVRKKDPQETSSKKNTLKRSRIEKELAIDTVEGHPFLKTNTGKRLTRKNLINSTTRRTSLVDKMNKSIKTPIKQDKKKDKEKTKDGSEKEKTKHVSAFDKVENLQNENGVGTEKEMIKDDSPKNKELPQDRSVESMESGPCSEDIIESSQDSTVTTISVKSAKPVNKKPLVVLENLRSLDEYVGKELETQNLLEVDAPNVTFNENKEETKEDIEIPQNKTAEEVHNEIDLTETMDTEPFDSEIVDEIIVIHDDAPIISLDTDFSVVGPETQGLAEADTLPNSIDDSAEIPTDKSVVELNRSTVDKSDLNKLNMENDIKAQVVTECNKIDKDVDVTVHETKEVPSEKDNDASSPFRDDVQRKQDFLDNTFEISPIKTMSPDRDKKSPSPETSNDYVVIKLSSPVQSNGEPFEKFDSPEIFTEEKISPEKRDQSPPRDAVAVNTSPSSSLSLKKHRPQVRSGGRAAQMLGLCVPDRLQTLKSSERSDLEEPKRISTLSTPARRNLRMLYNSVADNGENLEDNEDSENFLKLKRSLPTADSSPSVPILKRKLVDITDEATVSPASKRKRVSFHDPPVSTTISVHKYIEPCGIRSPQNSALKRQERQLRSQSNMKSQKRLDSVFKLDTVLNKAVESFDDSEKNLSSEDTQMTSLDETPVAEIVKTSDLNDTDPICPDLVDCTDPIDAIASELSSPATKLMFLKELEGKIVTIGDLAKMTELEVNRLCIKAPKVKIAKKVLADYALKMVLVDQEKQIVHEAIEMQEPPKEIVPETQRCDAEMQTNNVVYSDTEMQTDIKDFASVDMQTDNKATAQSYTQTIQSGSNSTEFVIASCLTERPDFIEELNKKLPDTSKQEIVDSVSFDVLKNSFLNKITHDNSSGVINDLLEKTVSGDTDLRRFQTYLSKTYKPRELILFCSELLHKIHDKSMLK